MTSARTPRLVAICLAAIVVAYHYSLSTLLKTLSLDTPLAYLGLVPAISLVLIARRARPHSGEPDIHDRQVDYIVGVPLLGAAVAIAVFLPQHLSTLFWVWRVDLLSLPLFAAGAVTLLFGVRTTWRFRFPLLFLLLAWPLPYTALLLKQLQGFSEATLTGVRVALRGLPVAHPLKGGDGSLFQIEYRKPFPVSVASACSGVNGVVGYALVSLAFVSEIVGRASRKALWVAAGLLLTWLINVGRIMTIFVVGRFFGPAVAIDTLHPILGLITFNVGVLVMILLLGRFGLELPLSAPKAKAAIADPADDRPATPVLPARSLAPAPYRLATTLVVAVGLICGIANTGLKSFELSASSLGSPRLVSFLQHPAQPVGWRNSKMASFDWTKPFFGSDSSWYRYEYRWDGVTPTAFHTRARLIADVVSTSDVSTFSTYGLEACYQFHGYRLRATRTVQLDGVVAHAVSYYNASIHAEWTSVYWVWAVRTSAGTRYERVTLMMSNVGGWMATAVPSGGQAQTAPTVPGSTSTTTAAQAQMTDTQRFLTAFAKDLVNRQPRARSAT